VLDGSGSGDVSYTFAVTGTLAKSPDLGSVETADTVSGTTVSGTVSDEIDGFRFSGNLRRLDVDGSASIQFEDADG
jgi:hypothetical protein